MANQRDRQKRGASIEEQYHELFQHSVSTSLLPLRDESSLEQPSPLKIVPSLTTYDGAYEEPIIGA